MTYIAGPYTARNNPPLAESFFNEAEKRLVARGEKVINPLKLPHKNPDDWVECMKLDIVELLTKCDKVYMLSGWEHSPGANLEHMIASALKYDIEYEEDQE